MKDIDDLLEEWHKSPDDGRSLDDWFAEHLGWTKEESIHWCETNEEPGIAWDGKIETLESILMWWGSRIPWEHSPDCEGLNLHCCEPVHKYESWASIESGTSCLRGNDPSVLYFRATPGSRAQEVEIGDKIVYRGEGFFKLVKNA